ncbi:EamA family transporter [Catellatospora bangladeshensis]
MPTATEALILLYLAVMMTVVAFLAWFTGLRLLGVERAGMFTGLVPAATLTVAALQDQALPGLTQTAGVLVVVAGLVWGAAGGRTPAPAAPEPISAPPRSLSGAEA